MKRLLVVLVLAVAVLCALPATASIFLAMDQVELVAASEAVVLGEVTQVRAFWNDDATAIVTEAEFRVDEVLAGAAPPIVTVRTFGGTVGRLRIEALGFPVFHTGERLVLYLSDLAGPATVVGYQQGEYRITTRRSDGTEIAVPAVDHGAHFVHLDGSAAARPRALPLTNLRDQIRQAGTPERSVLQEVR
ncbi:MAG TPA: hypothetical protein VM617_02475 [Thermoanaerobaculia bacterium]|nr:hypothetical protein [Thermoanaerobaculia bacterium]